MPRPAVIKFYRAGHNLKRVALAIPVHYLSVKQVCDGREPDMRMGSDIEPLSR